MPVVVTRDGEGKLHAFENRCAHRGSLLVLNESGEARDITCVYHNWSYDLAGNLTGVAFRKGLGGKGGMPPQCRPETHGPRKLRLQVVCGLVFGTLSAETPTLEQYLGPDILSRIRRVMRAPVKLLGSYSQTLPSNWKLYMENEGQLSHKSSRTFFTLPSQPALAKGHCGERSGGHHVSYSSSPIAVEGSMSKPGCVPRRKDSVSRSPGCWRRSTSSATVSVADFSVFPAFVLQQTRNSLAVRRLVPQDWKDRVSLDVFGCNDDEEMTDVACGRSQSIGPAGYISMEDGWRGFVQRGVASAPVFYRSSKWVVQHRLGTIASEAAVPVLEGLSPANGSLNPARGRAKLGHEHRPQFGAEPQCPLRRGDRRQRA
jgi:anthranilate 1,2-dioxygenase large subunit/terephthalate 1,2-dioxygenase oxygenase component alpha subunit